LFFLAFTKMSSAKNIILAALGVALLLYLLRSGHSSTSVFRAGSAEMNAGAVRVSAAALARWRDDAPHVQMVERVSAVGAPFQQLVERP
jgi:hypothetical protein